MKLNIIKRGKVVHTGTKRRGIDGKVVIFSVCNGRWTADDKVSEGGIEEITCKRCTKYAQEALQNDGVVTINNRKR